MTEAQKSIRYAINHITEAIADLEAWNRSAASEQIGALRKTRLDLEKLKEPIKLIKSPDYAALANDVRDPG